MYIRRIPLDLSELLTDSFHLPHRYVSYSVYFIHLQPTILSSYTIGLCVLLILYAYFIYFSCHLSCYWIYFTPLISFPHRYLCPSTYLLSCFSCFVFSLYLIDILPVPHIVNLSFSSHVYLDLFYCSHMFHLANAHLFSLTYTCTSIFDHTCVIFICCSLHSSISVVRLAIGLSENQRFSINPMVPGKKGPG